MTSRYALCFLALGSLPACGDLTDVPARVEDVRYRADGTQVVFTQAGIKVYQGDLATEVASISLAGPDYPGGAYDLSADGRLASVTFSYALDLSTNPPTPTRDNDVRLYGIQDGSLLGDVDLKNFELAATLSPSADLAFAFNSPANPQDEAPAFRDSLYRFSDGAQLWTLDELPLYKQLKGSSNYCGVAEPQLRPLPVFSPDGQTVYVPLFEYVLAVEVATGAAQVFANAHACVAWVDLLPDGSLLVLRGFAPRVPGTDDGSVPADEAQDSSLAFFAADGSLVREIPRFSDYSTAATFWGDGVQVACAPAGDRCSLAIQQPRLSFDPTTGITTQPTSESVLVFGLDGTLLQSIPMDGVPGRMSFSPDGSKLAMVVGSSDNDGRGGVRIYRVADGAVLAERTYTSGVF